MHVKVVLTPYIYVIKMEIKQLIGLIMLVLLFITFIIYPLVLKLGFWTAIYVFGLSVLITGLFVLAIDLIIG